MNSSGEHLERKIHIQNLNTAGQSVEKNSEIKEVTELPENIANKLALYITSCFLCITWGCWQKGSLTGPEANISGISGVEVQLRDISNWPI